MIANFYADVVLVALLTSLACCIPGIFLVLRGIALMSDAISHAILPGIVLMFLWTQKLESPLLIIGASLAGIASVMVTQAIIHTNRLKKDAAIGLVFPFFFSMGILLISKCTAHVHLDVDMVLLGELVFAPFNRIIFSGIDYGPSALWCMALVCIINCLLLILFYKELVISTFDPIMAQLLGFGSAWIYYGLMVATSITCVAAFNCVGSIVVVALMVIPAASAYLITTHINQMIVITLLHACLGSIIGCILARWADVSLSGSIAAMQGAIFMFAVIFAPKKGIISRFLSNMGKNLTFSRNS